MAGDLLPLLMTAAFSDKDDPSTKKIEKEIEKKMEEKMNENDLPFSTEEKIIETIKQNDKWYINLNIGTTNEIKKLKEEAQQAEKEKKFYVARDKYNEIKKLQGQTDDIESKLKNLDSEIASFEEKQKYIKNITLKDVEVFDYEDFFDGKVKSFKGTVVNNTDKTFTKIILTVYMYDKQGNIIAEQDFNPIDYGKPFKPKFVKDFAWKLEEYAPKEWSGKIKVEITDVIIQ